MTALQLGLLGTLRILREGEERTARFPKKAQALLAYLAATRQKQPREKLAGLLWSDMLEARARKNLRDVLNALRREAGDCLTVTRQSVALDDSIAEHTDVQAFLDSDAGMAALAIAMALELPLQATSHRSIREQLQRFLRKRRLLLLLDNYEHLLDAATLPADLLQAAPHLQIVVTSREPLNLYEEQRFPLAGLSCPESSLLRRSGKLDETPIEEVASYSAPRHFLERSRRVQPDFKISAASAPALLKLCRLVEGMPLALELAAGWSDQVSVAAIAGEIERDLSILETELRNVPARHRSMTAVFEGAWRRLLVDEQALMARLSVFRGGFTRRLPT